MQSRLAGLRRLLLRNTRSSPGEIPRWVAPAALTKWLLRSRFSPRRQPPTSPASSSLLTAATPFRNIKGRPISTTESSLMPELPDISAYITALELRIIGEPIEHVRLASPFLLRTVEPPIASVEGRRVRELRRIGKRIAIGLEDDLWLVLHLMIAGRLHWRAKGAKLAGRNQPAAFDFPNGSLVLTEAGAKRRASLHVLKDEESLREMDPGGIEVFAIDMPSFQAALTAENRTLKRALTDPRIVSGIGNAYSDEILHAAQLSPIKLTHKLTPPEWERLFAAIRSTLQRWINQLKTEASTKFPEKVTAFRKDMAVHGRY